MVEHDVVERLTDDPGVAALIVSDGIARIRPFPLPQTEPVPAISFARIATTPAYTYRGRTPYESVLLQLTCWAETSEEAAELAAAIKNALDGKPVPVGKKGGQGSQVAFLENEDWDFEPSPRPLHRHDLDFRLAYLGG